MRERLRLDPGAMGAGLASDPSVVETLLIDAILCHSGTGVEIQVKFLLTISLHEFTCSWGLCQTEFNIKFASDILLQIHKGRHMAYQKSSEWYDLIYRWKDYPAEVELLRQWINTYATIEPTTLLDVACGTGAHLIHFNEHFTCEGVDISTEQLAVARTRLPDVPLHHADMRTFDLQKTFDVVTCLFSSIGYMHSIDDLHLALANMARHVNRGGVVIVEPWFAPDVFVSGHLSANFIDEPHVKLARMSYNLVEGRMSIMDMHHLVVTRNGVEHFVEHHEMMLFTQDEYLSAFEACGLNVAFEAEGLTGRGGYIGVK